MFGAEEMKERAALHALEFVADGMRLGLGTGSTAAKFVDALGAQVRDGLRVIGVPTSDATAEQARRLGIPLASLDEYPRLDLTVDGADEFDDQLRLIKGGGAALLREKIVATASDRMVVIADSSKWVERLGAFPLPIEIVRFGMKSTMTMIQALAAEAGCKGEIRVRLRGGEPVLTDNGNLIVDCAFGEIPEPEVLSYALARAPGIVEHGLFIGLADAVIVADPREVRVLGGSDVRKSRATRRPAQS